MAETIVARIRLLKPGILIEKSERVEPRCMVVALDLNSERNDGVSWGVCAG